MRALIDADIITTPIGQCVVLPPEPEQPFWWSWDDFTVGDVLAVVTSSSISDAVPRWLRNGFVRVLKVLPVVDTYAGGDMPYPCLEVHPDHADSRPAPPGASPGDVVLVVEPWCETCRGTGLVGREDEVGRTARCTPDCRHVPVTVTHRDGVLGEIGDNDE